jgi:hypothetical protein
MMLDLFGFIYGVLCQLKNIDLGGLPRSFDSSL